MADEEKNSVPGYGYEKGERSGGGPVDGPYNDPLFQEKLKAERKKFEDRQMRLIQEAKEEDRIKQDELRKTGRDRESIRLRALQAEAEQEAQRENALREEVNRKEYERQVIVAEQKRVALERAQSAEKQSNAIPSGSPGTGCLLVVIGVVALATLLPALCVNSIVALIASHTPR